MTTTTVTVTAENFAEKVLGSDKPVLVDFWAAWCQPCLRLAPILEQLADEESEQFAVAKVNVEDYPELAERYDVQAFPTLNLFRDGEIVHQVVGLLPKQLLKSELSAHL